MPPRGPRGAGVPVIVLTDDVGPLGIWYRVGGKLGSFEEGLTLFRKWRGDGSRVWRSFTSSRVTRLPSRGEESEESFVEAPPGLFRYTPASSRVESFR